MSSHIFAEYLIYRVRSVLENSWELLAEFFLVYLKKIDFKHFSLKKLESEVVIDFFKMPSNTSFKPLKKWIFRSLKILEFLLKNPWIYPWKSLNISLKILEYFLENPWIFLWKSLNCDLNFCYGPCIYLWSQKGITRCGLNC